MEFSKRIEELGKKVRPRKPKGRPRGPKRVSSVIGPDPNIVILEANPPQRIKILGLQDWKYWKIGSTARIGKNVWKNCRDWRIGYPGSDTPWGRRIIIL